MTLRTDVGGEKKPLKYLETFDLNELTFVQSRLKESLGKWTSDWFSLEHGMTLSELKPYEFVAQGTDDIGDFVECETTLGGKFWIGDLVKVKHTLKELLFGISSMQKPVTTMIDEIVEACLSDFKGMLAILFDVQHFANSRPIGDERLGIWSGLYVCRLELNRQIIRIILDSKCFEHLLAGVDGLARKQSSIERRSKRTPVLDAIQSSKIKLAVVMQGCEVDLGQLQALRVGDIVTLQHRLDQALSVVDSKQEPVCEAFIGASRGLKAVELSAVVSNI